MVQRTRTKICGITSKEDAQAAMRAGADAIGLVFYAPSPRAVTPEQAVEVLSSTSPFVTTVGLFVNHDKAFIERVLATVPLDLLQFHGDETPAFCEQFARPYIKAVRVRSVRDVVDADAAYKGAQGILVDAYKKGVAGGTGETFDWGMVPVERHKPLILAGGLTVSNVRNAIGQVRPYAVDVSGGVEREKGVKDHAKIEQFMKEVSRGG